MMKIALVVMFCLVAGISSAQDRVADITDRQEYGKGTESLAGTVQAVRLSSLQTAPATLIRR